jgi:hypothetical protein
MQDEGETIYMHTSIHGPYYINRKVLRAWKLETMFGLTDISSTR